VVSPLQPLELRTPCKARWVWAGAVANFFTMFLRLHVLVTVRQGQRRDAAATGEERLGRCAAGQSKYIRLYRYSGKLALAAMYLRRVQLCGGCSTTDACLYRWRLRHKTSAWASGGPAGGWRVATCLRRWRGLPLCSPTRRWRALPLAVQRDQTKFHSTQAK
jgi:hypothetical protein